MDLKQTIAELERQAAQYTEAANALRALMTQPGTRSAPSSDEGEDAPRRRGPKKGSRRGTRTVSPETRAKIAEKVKARHAARRAAQEGNQSQVSTETPTSPDENNG